MLRPTAAWRAKQLRNDPAAFNAILCANQHSTSLQCCPSSPMLELPRGKPLVVFAACLLVGRLSRETLGEASLPRHATMGPLCIMLVPKVALALSIIWALSSSREQNIALGMARP